MTFFQKFIVGSKSFSKNLTYFEYLKEDRYGNK